MTNGDTWVKVYRKFIDWEWYKDSNTKSVFLHLLLTANIGTSKYKGFVLTEGQLITSVAEISEATGLSARQIRTALEHLKMTNEVTIKTTNKFSLVTVVNWTFYQINTEEKTSKTAIKMTNDRQTTDKQPTSLIKEEKELKNNIYGDYQPPDISSSPSKKEVDTFFESIWVLYPNKKGKGQIKDAQRKRLFELGYDIIAKCIERYMIDKESWKAYQHGSTFFNSGYVDYLDENYTEPQSESSVAPNSRYKVDSS